MLKYLIGLLGMILVLVWIGLSTSQDGAMEESGRERGLADTGGNLEAAKAAANAEAELPGSALSEADSAISLASEEPSELLANADYYGRTTSDVEAVDFGPKLDADDYGYVVQNDEIVDVGPSMTVESLDAPGALLRPKDVGELLSADRVGYLEEDFPAIDVGSGTLKP